MNLGKDSNNQSLDAFDDMTFDDMTFDDEPLQGNFQSNNIPNEDMVNANQNYNEQNIVNTQVEMQQAQPINMQQQVQGFNVQSQIPMQKGKVKKAKKEKAPKAPKQKKNKQQNVNQANAMMLGNQPEEDLEQKKINLKIIIPAIIVAVVALVLVVVLNLPKNTDKHITLATNTPVISDNTEVDNNIEVSTVGDSTANKDKDNNTEVVDNTQNESSATVLTLNNPMKIGVVVNTKLEGDTEYTDHESYLKIEYSNFVSGYDNVKVYLDEYNETATNKINLPDKDTFYESSVGNDLVMYEITVTVPDDFPTNDAKHGFTGLNPEFGFEIKGTEKEDALITKLYEFAIPSVYYIGSDTSEFTIGSTYTLRYMTTMPMELKANGYKLTFVYSNDGKSERYGLQSLDIPSNKDAVEMTEETVEALTEETTETEVNDEEQKAE